MKKCSALTFVISLLISSLISVNAEFTTDFADKVAAQEIRDIDIQNMLHR